MPERTVARSLILLTVLATALLAVGLPAGAGVRSTTLHGVVGPSFSISLKHDDGTRVTNLDPGTYSIVVEDNSAEHNFHLVGAGVDQSTDIETTGTVTWDVTVQDGQTYRYRCDAHPSTMRGSFTVGSSSPGP